MAQGVALSTVNTISLKYAVESTAGTKPTINTEIFDIVSLGELSGTPDNLDASTLKSEWREYIAGIKDTGGDFTLTANFTKAFLTSWNTLVSAAETAKAAGKATWFEVTVTGLGTFDMTGDPVDLGLPAADINTVFQVTAHIVPTKVTGWTAEA